MLRPILDNMKLILLFGLLLLASFELIGASNAQAAQNPETGDAPLCLPNVDLLSAGECLHLGPAHYLSSMAELGIYFPPTPLPAKTPDPALAFVPYHYARVVKENAPVFPSLEDAIRGESVLRRVEAGFNFVTYIDQTEVDGKRYFMIDQGIWMRGSDLSRISATSNFQGLIFLETPKNAFGWMRNQAEVKRTPGYEPQDYTGKILNPYDVVQVYKTEKVGDMDWYLIGPDQWIEGRQVGRVLPNPISPERVKNKRWIEINLAEQTLAVYDQSRLVFATLVATGREGTWTRPGVFQIYKKVAAETMQGTTETDRSDFYYLEDVPWTIYFDQARALHGTFWHNRFGWPQSRGCVNLSPGDANWLFQWAKEGDWVYVWDPTGQTPTDPSYYGAGGA